MTVTASSHKRHRVAQNVGETGCGHSSWEGLASTRAAAARLQMIRTFAAVFDLILAHLQFAACSCSVLFVDTGRAR